MATEDTENLQDEKPATQIITTKRTKLGTERPVKLFFPLLLSDLCG